VKATRSGLDQSGGELASEQRAAIENAITSLEQVLAAESQETHSGDLQKLKEAHATLDETTRPLADLMMDKAMEAMLRKRGLIA
jgi:molecular chaperone DnaK (HSP70)